MKIRMLTTENGSVDGIRVSVYSAGAEYDLSDCRGAKELAAAFIGASMAVEIADDDPVAVVRNEAEPEPTSDSEPVDQVVEPEVVAPVSHGKPGRKPKK